ncbi:MAG: hypothetical protein IJD80_07045 [Oscillospiraceae bacterium]|nr:hypothetical protein [Oscillospiraceae bacterium]
MKYTVKAEGSLIDVQEMLFEEAEKADIKTAIENMAKGTTAAMFEFVQNFSDSDKKSRLLFDALLDYMSLISEDVFSEKAAEPVNEEVDYKEYEDQFIIWIYEQGYDDPYAFGEEYADRQLSLDFSVEGDTALVYISADGEKMNEIGEIQGYLFEDEPGMAKQMCVEFTAVAVLAFDKAYSIDSNPLRRVSAYDLENRIKEALL